MEEKELFTSPPSPIPCTYVECINGHRSGAVLAIATCGGCQSPVLMSKLENCPYCNEPISKIVIRNDHIPRGSGVGKRCLGEKVWGETQNIELQKTYWKEAEVVNEEKLHKKIQEITTE